MSLSCRPGSIGPTVTPQIKLSHTLIEEGTPLEMNYIFTTGPDFPGYKKSLTVFVRFLDPKGNVRFLDDHLPPVVTNQWVPSQEYRYTRTLIVPEGIPAGEYQIELGLYAPTGRGENVELAGKKLTPRSVEVARLHILPPAGPNEVKYVSGWYDSEHDPGNIWFHWRWTQKQAVVQVKNPHADSVLYLKVESDPKRFSRPQRLTVKVNDSLIEQFPLEQDTTDLRKYSIKAQALGSAEWVNVMLDVDLTFHPSDDGVSQDSRELGARVSVVSLVSASSR